MASAELAAVRQGSGARTGAWNDDTLEIAFENLVADEFEEGVSEEEALDQVVAAAGIEPEKIQIVPAKFNGAYPAGCRI